MVDAMDTGCRANIVVSSLHCTPNEGWIWTSPVVRSDHRGHSGVHGRERTHHRVGHPLCE